MRRGRTELMGAGVGEPVKRRMIQRAKRYAIQRASVAVVECVAVTA